jgi:hypothetical protein
MSNSNARPEHGEQQSEYPKVGKRRPDKERKVWVEVYPGGDCQIELGHKDGPEQYLQGNEAEALRDLLNELLPEANNDE